MSDRYSAVYCAVYYDVLLSKKMYSTHLMHNLCIVGLSLMVWNVFGVMV